MQSLLAFNFAPSTNTVRRLTTSFSAADWEVSSSLGRGALLCAGRCALSHLLHLSDCFADLLHSTRLSDAREYERHQRQRQTHSREQFASPGEFGLRLCHKIGCIYVLGNWVPPSYVFVCRMRQLFWMLVVTGIALDPALGQGKLAIVNVTIIDGTDHPPRRNSTIIVEGKKIIAITGDRQTASKGTRIVDGTGKFLIPGLWNNDLHEVSYDDARSHLSDLVAQGITAVRDMGAPLDDVVRLRDATVSGALVGPRVFIAGPLMEGPVPIKMPLIVDLFSEKQAHEEVKSLKQHNVDYVEVDTTLTAELYWAVADEAKRQSLPLVGHIPATIAAEDVAKANQRDVEHLGGRFLNVLISCSSDEAYFQEVNKKTFNELLVALREKRQADEPQFRADFGNKLLNTFDEPKAQRLFRLYAQEGVAQTPTLHALKTLWQTNKDGDKLNDQDMRVGELIFAKDLAMIGEMKRAGVTILAGTDGSYGEGGDALHSELELLVDAGLTPLQAIQAASRDAAKAMGVSVDMGTLEVGKTADLVLLDADPLKDISNTRKINAVVLDGQFFLKGKLSSIQKSLNHSVDLSPSCETRV